LTFLFPQSVDVCRLAATAAVCLAGLLAPVRAAALEPPGFEGEGEARSDSGHHTLAWTHPATNLYFEVDVAPTAAFDDPRRLYQGPDLATFISGLEDGTYVYRVRARTSPDAPPSPWSESYRLTVKHPSLRLALTLFVVGGVVFVLTAAVVLKGDRSGEDGGEA
jgi:hypothetical protein